MAGFWQALRNAAARRYREALYFYVSGEQLFHEEYVKGVRGQTSVYLAEDIVTIVAYKVDCLTIDQIRFEIEFSDGKIVSITEDGLAFMAFEQYCLARLEDFDRDWRSKVTLPPFERCETCVFERIGPTKP